MCRWSWLGIGMGDKKKGFRKEALLLVYESLVKNFVQNMCQTVTGVQKLLFEERGEVVYELV